MNVEYELPMGCRFSPTEEELISHYLRKKTMGDPLPEAQGKIVERRLYGEDADPWNVFKEDDPWQDVEGSLSKKILYVFCKRMPMSGKSKIRASRTAGCGTWEGKAVVQEIRSRDKGCVIGLKRQFAFKVKKEELEEMEGRGHWIMHEFSLLPTESKDYVICKITWDLSKVVCSESSDNVDIHSTGKKKKKMKMMRKKKKKRVFDIESSDDNENNTLTRNSEGGCLPSNDLENQQQPLKDGNQTALVDSDELHLTEEFVDHNGLFCIEEQQKQEELIVSNMIRRDEREIVPYSWLSMPSH